MTYTKEELFVKAEELINEYVNSSKDPSMDIIKENLRGGIETAIEHIFSFPDKITIGDISDYHYTAPTSEADIMFTSLVKNYIMESDKKGLIIPGFSYAEVVDEVALVLSDKSLFGGKKEEREFKKACDKLLAFVLSLDHKFTCEDYKIFRTSGKLTENEIYFTNTIRHSLFD